VIGPRGQDTEREVAEAKPPLWGHPWRDDNSDDSRASDSSSRDIVTPPTGPPSWGSKGVESQGCPYFNLGSWFATRE
jgi:hypothetical protein